MPLYNQSGYGTGRYGIADTGPIYALGISYYLGLLTSEYRLAPNLNAWLQDLLSPLNDTTNMITGMTEAFDLSYAEGVQLDVLGQIAGVSRTVGFQPTGTGTILDIPLTQQGGGYIDPTMVAVTITGNGSGASAHVAGINPGSRGGLSGIIVDTPGRDYTYATVTLSAPPPGIYANQAYAVADIGSGAVLDDDTYRLLIKATIAANEWDGTEEALYPIWKSLFPGGSIIIADNQNMTCTIVLSGTFTSIIEDLIVNGYIVPRPEGVLYTYVFGDFPIFGTDESNLFIAGVDLGHLA